MRVKKVFNPWKSSVEDVVDGVFSRIKKRNKDKAFMERLKLLWSLVGLTQVLELNMKYISLNIFWSIFVRLIICCAS